MCGFDRVSVFAFYTICIYPGLAGFGFRFRAWGLEGLPGPRNNLPFQGSFSCFFTGRLLGVKVVLRVFVVFVVWGLGFRVSGLDPRVPTIGFSG